MSWVFQVVSTAAASARLASMASAGRTFAAERNGAIESRASAMEAVFMLRGWGAMCRQVFGLERISRMPRSGAHSDAVSRAGASLFQRNFDAGGAFDRPGGVGCEIEFTVVFAVD